MAATSSASLSSKAVSDPVNKPPINFTTQSGKAGVKTYVGVEKLGASEEALSAANGVHFEYSSDGSLLAIATAVDVSIFKVENGELVSKIQRKSVAHLSFSPLGTYLQTWEHMPKELSEEERKTYGNLIVWNTKTGEEVIHFIQKAFVKESWPSIRWSIDEVISSRMVANEIQIYAGKLGQVTRVIKLPAVNNYAIAPTLAPYKIATFVPESKGNSAFVKIFKYPNVTDSVAHKSFFKAQTVELKWNSDGTALLIGTHTDVDKTGKSYYGEDSLYFMTAEGKSENVTLTKDGPIHDTAWSPTGKEFVVTYGFMPSKSTLFGADCKPKCDFGEAPRNFIRWDPFGQLVCLAGFGNLKGDMDIWDVKKLKKVGTATAHCAAHCEWSPDGIHILTAVLSPRIRVDNGFKIWKCDGSLLHEEGVDELLKVSWRQLPSNVYTAPRVPKPLPAKAKAAPGAAPAAPAKYRHPNFSGSTAAPLKAESTGPVKYVAPGAKAAAQKNAPPGMAYENKSKKKREKKKAQKVEVAQVEEPEVTEEALDPAAIEKKIKALNKKLRQITLLKEQQAEGKPMSAGQLEKIAGEAALKGEIATLEAKKA